MSEEAAVSKIIATIDSLLEQAEATVLRLDVNQNNFERTGKFVPNKNDKAEFLVVNRFRNGNFKMMIESPTNSSATGSTSSGKSPSSSPLISSPLISSPLKSSPLMSSPLKSSPLMSSPLMSSPGTQYSKSYEILAQSSLSAVSPIKNKKKKKTNEKASPKDLDSKNTGDQQEDAAAADIEKELADMKKYEALVKNCKKCKKCSRMLVPTPSDSDHSLMSSIVSPEMSIYSAKTEQPPKERSNAKASRKPQRSPREAPILKMVRENSVTDSISTTRMTSSIVTEDDEATESSFPQSPCQSLRLEKARSSTSSKNLYQTAPSQSGVSLNFTAVVKDPKTGKSHPLHVAAKCFDGTPARVFINGKAFGPCSE